MLLIHLDPGAWQKITYSHRAITNGSVYAVIDLEMVPTRRPKSLMLIYCSLLQSKLKYYMYSRRLLEEEQGKVVCRQQRDQHNCYWANVICTTKREKKINDGIVCYLLVCKVCTLTRRKTKLFLQDKLFLQRRDLDWSVNNCGIQLKII